MILIRSESIWGQFTRAGKHESRPVCWWLRDVVGVAVNRSYSTRSTGCKYPLPSYDSRARSYKSIALTTVGRDPKTFIASSPNGLFGDSIRSSRFNSRLPICFV